MSILNVYKLLGAHQDLVTGDQKVSAHLIITVQSGAQRLFDHPVLRLGHISGKVGVNEWV